MGNKKILFILKGATKKYLLPLLFISFSLTSQCPFVDLWKIGDMHIVSYYTWFTMTV
tara:strand:+ start:695 stop:865 length:171 start_codon:yes stop_codon:yes gene_type:complete